jgi:N-acetylmuramic acid 6-phosphate etherase
VLGNLVTEQRNPASEQIDRLSTPQLLEVINREDQKVASAVEAQIPRIAEAVDAIVERYRRGGRLFYLGTGTSGRLGVLDAAECPPTFGVSADRVQAVIAGGRDALFQAVEGAEDSLEAAQADLRERDLCGEDALVGISASGRTPYVLGGIAYGRSIGALTIGLGSTPDSELAAAAEIAVTPVTGPEVITGSTRMKCGTAQSVGLQSRTCGRSLETGGQRCPPCDRDGEVSD